MFKKEIRERILKRDAYQCQLNRFFGISIISDVPCSDELEIHHRNYDKAKKDKERIKDGITVCKRCHEFLTNIIRNQRYSKRNNIPKDLKQRIPEIKIKEKKSVKVSMQDYRDNSPNSTQGRNGRSPRPFYERN